MQAYLAQLHNLLQSRFNLDELKLLCLHLGIDYENAPNQSKTSLCLHLLQQATAQDRLPDLLEMLRQLRPHIIWPDPPPDAPAPSLPPASLQNPFGHNGRIHSPHHYLIRHPLTPQILDELKKGASISLVGDSQTGKSSLLYHISQQGVASLPSFHHFIYLSLELIHSDDDFFAYICDELALPSQRGFRLARALRGQRVLLCLDEIEKMAWDGFSLNVRTELRGLADGADAPFALLIASRSSLGQLFPDSPHMTSPLAGLCTQLKMPYFSLAEAQALVEQYCSPLGQSMPEDEVAQAWQQSQGHPHRLQQDLQALFNRDLL